MENIQEKNNTIYNYPFLFSIAIFLIYNSIVAILGLITTVVGSFTVTDYESFKSSLKTLSPLTAIICFISTIILNIVFKNLTIYKRGNFHKTLKASAVYLLFTTLVLISVLYFKINNNSQFKPISGIFSGIFILVFGLSFTEESLFRGLILNIFAKKYLNKPNGVFKILMYPTIIFSAVHLFNVFNDVSLEKTILQTVLAFFIGILLNAIYLRGGNIFVLILIHAIIDATGMFDTLFLDTNITFSQSINNLDYTPLLLAPLYLLLTFFLLRKSKLKEIKETLKEINK